MLLSGLLDYSLYIKINEWNLFNKVYFSSGLEYIFINYMVDVGLNLVLYK